MLANLSAAVPGVHCDVNVSVAEGSGEYRLQAWAGIAPEGYYIAACFLSWCPSRDFSDCNELLSAYSSLPRGGAVFRELDLTIVAPKTNTYFHGAMCDDYQMPSPRSSVALAPGGTNQRVVRFSGTCALKKAYVVAFAQSENEREQCRHDSSMEYPVGNITVTFMGNARTIVLTFGSLSGICVALVCVMRGRQHQKAWTLLRSSSTDSSNSFGVSED